MDHSVLFFDVIDHFHVLNAAELPHHDSLQSGLLNDEVLVVDAQFDLLSFVVDDQDPHVRSGVLFVVLVLVDEVNREVEA